MNLKRHILLLLLLTLVSCHATGSYPAQAGLTTTSSPTDLFDAARYNQGKDIITGRVTLSDSSKDPEARSIQLRVLTNFADKLPAPLQERFNLPGLAGHLSADGLEAVTYFLMTRFKLDDKPPKPAIIPYLPTLPTLSVPDVPVPKPEPAVETTPQN